MITHQHIIRVRYRDIDYLGTVYYSRYLEYFEEARDELMHALGMPYSQFEQTGYAMPVIEAHCVYHHGAVFDEELLITSRVEHLPTARLRIDYTINARGDQKLIAEGYTIHAFINSQKRAVKPPRFFMDLLNQKWQKE